MKNKSRCCNMSLKPGGGGGGGEYVYVFIGKVGLQLQMVLVLGVNELPFNGWY